MVKKIDKMETIQKVKDRERFKKTMRKVIKKDIKINYLDRNMILVEHHHAN